MRRVVPDGWSLDASVERLSGAESLEAYRLGASGRLAALDWGVAARAHWSVQTLQALNGATRHSAGVSIGAAHWRLSGGAFDEPTLMRHGAYVRLEAAAQPRPDLHAIGYLDAEYASGGPPSYWRAGMVAAWLPAPGWTLLGHATFHRDLAGYSPWLEEGAAREMRSLSLALERGWQPASGVWRILARTHVGRRWSNLDLFEYRDAGIQFTLQRRWK